MDEEVLLESSPLYEHLKQLDSNEFNVSALTKVVKEQSNESAQPAKSNSADPSTREHRCDTRLSPIFGTKKAETRIKYEMCLQLLNSSDLAREHYSLLKSYLDSYLPPEYHLTDEPSVPWLMAHGLAAAVCLSQASHVWKVAAVMSWCSHLMSPLLARTMSHILNRKLCHAKSNISGKLEIFKQAVSALNRVQIFCQELHLMSLGTRAGPSLLSPEGTDSMADILKDSVIRYLNESIIKLREDLNAIIKLVDCPLIPNLQLVHTKPSLGCQQNDTVLSDRKELLCLISQWIFYLALAITSNNSSELLVTLIAKLNGLQPPHHLVRDLKYCRAVADDELPRATVESKPLLSKEEQALHSLYLHSRQLLTLAKLAHTETDCRTEQVFHAMSAHIKDCTTCLSLASKKSQPLQCSPKAEAVLKAADDVAPEIAMSQPLPVIDEVFVTENAESADDGCAADDEHNWQTALQRQYEITLMYELKGVIHELAKERMERELQVEERRGLSVEAIAKLTKELVYSRDIKSLVKSSTAVNERPEGRCEEGRSGAANDDRQPRPNEKYRYCDELAPDARNISSEMKQLAEMVAQRFVEQQESEETFVSGGEDSDG